MGSSGGFGLIVTTYRGAERRASSELLKFLSEAGNAGADVSLTGLPGVILARIAINPLTFIEHLYRVVADEPWRMRLLLRVIPLEEIVPADVRAIADASKRLAVKIGDRESFRVILERRASGIDRDEVIKAVASGIDREVDLENPGWTVLVEVVGDEAGVSVVRAPYVFSAIRAKRGDIHLSPGEN